MLAIAWALLGGWVLGLFGFKAVVIAGMAQVFNVTLNTLGYYFLFGMFGATRRVAMLFGSGSRQQEKAQAKIDLGKAVSKIKKSK